MCPGGGWRAVGGIKSNFTAKQPDWVIVGCDSPAPALASGEWWCYSQRRGCSQRVVQKMKVCAEFQAESSHG